MMSDQAHEVLAAQWREPGFTCPNSKTYPWLWLWDSCFHSIVWAELGDTERALSELTTALSAQDVDGFVPHVIYLDGSTDHEQFWGRANTSSITQPPIYGHAIAELARRGIAIPLDLLERATAGLNFLFESRRRSTAGLIELVHPWESGCDHSPRWDDLILASSGVPASAGFDEQTWFRRKGELLQGIQRKAGGAPIHNDDFPVGSVAFSAMTVFCAAELAGVTGDTALLRHAADVSAALAERWEPQLRTWVDDGPTALGSGRVRTAEALLGVLALPVMGSGNSAMTQAVAGLVADELSDVRAFAGEFGARQVHVDEPTYLPTTYWRGPSWPQLNYLLWIGLLRVGKFAEASQLARNSRLGAQRSGWAEYWDADTGRPGGAVPQSWTTLAICMSASEV